MRVEMILTDDVGTEDEIDLQFGDLISINPNTDTWISLRTVGIFLQVVNNLRSCLTHGVKNKIAGLKQRVRERRGKRCELLKRPGD